MVMGLIGWIVCISIYILWVIGVNCKYDYLVLIYFGWVYFNGIIVDVWNVVNKLKFFFLLKLMVFDFVVLLRVLLLLEISNGEEVMVLWFGVFFLSFKDVVVLYCFLEVEFDYYLDYVNVSSVEMYLKGYGEFDVFLWNLRKEC